MAFASSKLSRPENRVSMSSEASGVWKTEERAPAPSSDPELVELDPVDPKVDEFDDIWVENALEEVEP